MDLLRTTTPPSPRHSQPELQNECPNSHSGSKLQRRSPKETSTQDDMGVLMGWWGWVITVAQVQDKHNVVQQLLSECICVHTRLQPRNGNHNLCQQLLQLAGCWLLAA